MTREAWITQVKVMLSFITWKWMWNKWLSAFWGPTATHPEKPCKTCRPLGCHLRISSFLLQGIGLFAATCTDNLWLGAAMTREAWITQVKVVMYIIYSILIICMCCRYNEYMYSMYWFDYIYYIFQFIHHMGYGEYHLRWQLRWRQGRNFQGEDLQRENDVLNRWVRSSHVNINMGICQMASWCRKFWVTESQRLNFVRSNSEDWEANLVWNHQAL